jgi:hypothetical protein
MVAVKVIEYVQESGQKGPLEGLLSEQVHHPNVVSDTTPSQTDVCIRPAYTLYSFCLVADM